MPSRKKQSTASASNILVPLYVYPEVGAWEPLFTAIACHPGLSFIVVINPANGPGSMAGPDANYTREIPRLNAYSNVRTVGYVSTDYAKRSLNLVLQDIKAYSAWSEIANCPGMNMRGIFLDETSSQYESATAECFETIASAVRCEPGLGKNPLIIHNPGTIPDIGMLSSEICDLSVVFEGAYSTYNTCSIREQISKLEAASKSGRNKLACIVHAIPAAPSSNELTAFINELRAMVGTLFVTGLSVDYYASFSSCWDQFVDEMAVAHK